MATRELGPEPLHPGPSTTRERFERFYVWGEPWLRAVLAVRRVGEAPPPGALDPLARELEDTGLLAEFLAGYADLFDYIGYDEGWFFWARVPWEHVCTVRAALGSARDLLAPYPALVAQLDLAEVDERVARFAHELPGPILSG